MTKIDIISGFLGAGKTTLIKKLIQEAFAGQKIVLIENEFGEIAVDGGFLKDAGVNITEMNSGCICCSLVGDFGEALRQVMEQFAPERIIIEPSGVGKLSDVRRAVENVAADCDIQINSLTAVCDAMKVKMYMRNFGEFYNDQVESAGTIILSRTQKLNAEKLEQVADLLHEKNPKAIVVTTPWDDLGGEQLLSAMEHSVSLAEELMAEVEHHHHEHGEECTCGCHDHEHDHEHHDHEHHHHEHGEECTCGCHDHEHGHHHHHHADEVFTSWGRETTKCFTKEALEQILLTLDEGSCGMILRAKGMLPSGDGTWIYFDMVPGEFELRDGAPDYTGRLCVIGSKLDEGKLAELFGV
ncbi:MAG: GTP-binding protein [Lachnospiraceae bacterium]|nr:GTP-binding protein [Lachnospiraceae bacterium]